MPTVTIDYFGVTGSGRNVTEAKRDAGAKLERFVASYRPRSIHYRGTVYVIWTEPDGGVHSEQIVYRGEYRERRGSSWCGSVEEALQSIVGSLAQDVYPEPIADDDDLWDFLDREGQRRAKSDYRAWCAFQAAYKAAPPELTDIARHNWACDHQHEFRAAKTP